MRESLLILGASARAAAESARRAGLAPWTADLFADVDLKRIARAVRVKDYPAGLEVAARSAPPAAWMYTGGLENDPEMVDRIAAERPLLGNPGRVLKAVRDPFQVADALGAAGLPCPEVSAAAEGVPGDGTWLRKPLRGCSGTGITVWRDGAAGPEQVPPDVALASYFQKRITGRPCSAMYVASRGNAVLLGATRQLVGEEWTGAKPFEYAGSIGPLPLSPTIRRQLEDLGRVLAQRFALTGLFVVDAVLAGSTAWPVEINPRFGASAEVVERAYGVSALGLHLSACREGRIPETVPMPTGRWYGKAILYAPGDLAVPIPLEPLAERLAPSGRWPKLADIPATGSHISGGWPVVTVLGESASMAGVETELRIRLRRVRQALAELQGQRSLQWLQSPARPATPLE